MELKYGVLAGIACVVFRAFEFYMGWPDSDLGQYSAYIGILIMATGAYLCVKETRALHNDIISFYIIMEIKNRIPIALFIHHSNVKTDSKKSQ